MGLTYLGLAALAGAGVFAAWKLGIFGSAAAGGGGGGGGLVLYQPLVSGSSVTLTGSGAIPNQTVLILTSTSGPFPFTTTADALGKFSLQTTFSPGSYTAYASVPSFGLTSNTVSFTV